MIGWSEGVWLDQYLMTTDIDVLPPSECGNDSNFTHCSFVTPANNATICAFKLGSPLICDNSTIAGYMISEGCETRNGATIVRFYSASGYEEWQNVEIARNTTTTTTLRTTTILSTTTAGVDGMRVWNLLTIFLVFVVLINF